MPFFTQTLTYGSKTSQNHPQQLLKKKKKKKALHFFPQSKHFLHRTKAPKRKNLKNHRNRKKHSQALFSKKKRYT